MDVEIDPATGLPRRSGDLCETEGKALSGNYTETIEWMVADGIKVPRRILNYHRGRLVADIHTISARFDTGLKREDLAHRP